MKRFFTLLLLIVSSLGDCQTINIFLSTTDETCSSSNGTITASVSGGVPPYSYQWSNGSVTSAINGLAAGVYSLTVTDVNSTTASSTATIFNSPGLINAGLSYTVPGTLNTSTWPCNFACDGIAYAVLSQIVGTPPFYLTIETTTNPGIQPVQIGNNIGVANICREDQFTVRIFDAAGCSSLVQMFPPFPATSFNHSITINPACFGNNNGSILLDFYNLVSGLNNSALIVDYNGPLAGTAPVGNPIILSNLLPGNYSLSVRYSYNQGCDTSFTVTVPDLGFNCGVVNGSVYLDTVSNCQADTGEPLVPQQLIRFDPGPYFVTSDSSGNFSTGLPFNNYSATLLSLYPLHPVCNVSGITLSAQNDTVTIELGDSVNISTDIHAAITSGFFRPGFQGTLYVNVVNDSYDLIPYPQTEVYFDTSLTYTSSNFFPVASVPGHLTFMTNALLPFGSEVIAIHFTVPANPLLIGTPLNFIATVVANIPEPDTTDNSDSLTVFVTGSFDPNDKAVWPSRDSLNSWYTDVDEEFRYTIRFQNTGNDTAFTVLIVDTLSPALDPSTFSLMASSHPVLVEFYGSNTLKFRFNNILLPDSNTNEAASHGAVSFKIRPHLPLTVTSVENRADIYFDFNPPVLTNNVSSFITVSTGVINNITKSNIRIYPNPSSGIITIEIPGELMTNDVRIYSIQGAEVMKNLQSSPSSFLQLDATSLQSGLYFCSITLSDGQKIVSRLMIK